MILNEILNPGIENVVERNTSRHEQQLKIAGYVKESQPALAQRVVEDANLAMNGMLTLPGTGGEPYFVGNPPLWHDNPVNDNEYVWVLNRMEHWVTLLQAYLLEDNGAYAEKVVSELYDWVEKCPRPEIPAGLDEMYEEFDSPTPWRSLEIGMRMFKTWPSILTYLAGTPYFSEELLEIYAISVYEHSEVLRTVSPEFYPDADHNHYLMEMLGLYVAMVAFPEFKVSDKWKQFGKHELERCASAQITEGGGQIEGCPHYHNETMYYFYLAEMTAQNDGTNFSEDYRALLTKAIDYTIYTLRPTGVNVPWGDSDASTFAVRTGVYGYYSLNDRRCLNVLKILLGEEQTIQVALTYIWDTRDIDTFISALQAPAPDSIDMELSTYQKELKQVAFRTDWTTKAISIFFACRTPVYNTHQHIDPMGFDLTALGKALFVDPGRYTYSEDPLRQVFKSATSHSTITVNDTEPFEYISSWEFGPQKEGNIACFISDEHSFIAEAEQLNFEPHVHNRLIALMSSLVFIVADKVSSLQSESTVQIYYHRDTLDLEIADERLKDNSPDVRASIGCSANLEVSLLPGYVSELMDIKHDSQIIKLSDKGSDEGDRYYATIIVPYYANALEPQIDSVSISKDGVDAIIHFELNNQTYEYRWIIGQGLQ